MRPPCFHGLVVHLPAGRMQVLCDDTESGRERPGKMEDGRMEKNVDLLHGKILPSLTALAVPIMATAMVQTAYNLTDMAWVGRLGSGAVAAVGAAGMYTWLSSGLVAIARMGGQVKTSHAIGEGNSREAGMFGAGALQLTVALAVVFALATNLWAHPLIRFFALQDEKTVADAVVYLRIACGLIIFSFLNQTLTGLYTAAGDSRTPFLANCIGMGANMILDPLLIFGLGPVPRMEAAGAAIATVTAQAIVTAVLVLSAGKERVLFPHMQVFRPAPWRFWKVIIRIGVPAGLQSMIYCMISMVLTRFVSAWGDHAIAVQRVGSQIESISWMTADGFGTAINAFVGQNYGGRQFGRVKKGYMTAAAIVCVWGCITTAALVFGAVPIFRLFIQETEVIPLGADYLRILGYSQMFMCVELMTNGALSGLGKTFSCSVISIIFTSARIPLAIVLGGLMGLNGIWWAFTLSSIVKGILFFFFYLAVLKGLESRALKQKKI